MAFLRVAVGICFLLVLSVAAFGSATSAFAQSTANYEPGQVDYQKPSVRLVEDTLVSTADMQLFFQGKLAACGSNCRTDMADRSTEALYPIKALSEALARKDPTATSGEITGVEYVRRVFEYVRNNIRPEFRFGMGKGALGALIDKSGTAFDQVDLMAALLKERGVTGIEVKVGTITLTGTGITDRFGTSDAIVLCRMFADGGIAADLFVGGGSVSSSCATTGTVTSVTMAHAWLVVDGVAYDPANKKLIAPGSTDFTSRMGCNSSCASTVAAILPSPSTGSVPQISSINEASLSSKMTEYAISALNSVRMTNPNDSVWTVIGQERVDAKEYVAGDEAPPQPVAMFTAAASIPDPFRTKINIQYNGINTNIFGDDIYGRRIWISTLLRRNGPTTITANLSMDKLNSWLPLASGVTNTSAQKIDFSLRLAIDHPYPLVTHKANEIFQQLALPQADATKLPTNTDIRWPQLTLVYGAGRSAPQLVEQAGRLTNRLGDIEAGITATQVQVQDSRSFELLARLQNVVGVRHHSLGYIASPALGVPISTTLSISTTFSAVELNASQPKREAFAGAYAAVSSMIEGSVSQQAEDSWEAGSGVSLIVRANERSIPFYSVNAANRASAFGLLTDYTAEQLTALTDYTNLGYELVVPKDGKLGTFVVTTTCPPFSSCSQTAVDLAYGSVLAYKTNASAYLVGGRFKGAGAAGKGFDPIEGAQASAKQTSLALASQVLPSVPLGTGAMSLTPSADVVAGWPGSPGSLSFQRSFVGAQSSMNCRLSVESVRIFGTPPGTAPGAVMLERCIYNAQDSGMNGHIGAGWVHNFQLAAELSNNAMPMLGEQSATAAVPTLTAFQTLLQLHEVRSFRNVLAGAFVAKWLGDWFIGSTVSLNLGNQNMQFVRSANGEWIPPVGTGGKLEVTGTRTGPFIAVGAVRFDYRNVQIKYTSADGEEMEFYQPNKYSPSTFAYVGAPAITVAVPKFSATRSVGLGNVVTTYANLGVQNQLVQTWDTIITGASTSTGNKLRLNYWGQTLIMQQQNALPAAEHYVLSHVWSDVNGNNALDVSEPGVVFTRPNTLSYFNNPDYTLGAAYLTVTRLDGDSDSANNPKIRYVNKPGLDCSESTDNFSTIRTTLKVNIVELCSGGSSVINRASTQSDVLDRTVKVSDALGNVNKYFIGSTGGEILFRSERVLPPTDGATAIQTAWFNDRGDLIKEVDPLGRATINHYNDAHRLIRTIQPEGNATEYEFDQRGNLVRECKIAKGRVDWTAIASTNVRQLRCDKVQGDLVTETAFVGAPTLRPSECVSMKTCNKPSYMIDPKGHRTDFEWSPDHGQILKEIRPADENGVRPETTYSYTAFTGIDGAIFHLLTAKTEKISATTATTTTFEYDSANRFVLKSSVADSGGLNLRNCFKFDAAGNLISKTDPKAGPCT